MLKCFPALEIYSGDFFFFNMNFADVYHLELSIFMPIEMFCFELVFMGN